MDGSLKNSFVLNYLVHLMENLVVYLVFLFGLCLDKKAINAKPVIFKQYCLCFFSYSIILCLDPADVSKIERVATEINTSIINESYSRNKLKMKNEEERKELSTHKIQETALKLQQDENKLSNLLFYICIIFMFQQL